MSGSTILLGALQRQELVLSNCILDERSGRCLGSLAWPQAPAPPPPSWPALREPAPRSTHRRRRSAVGQGWTREGGGEEEGEGGEGQQAGGGGGAVALLLSPSSLPQPEFAVRQYKESHFSSYMVPQLSLTLIVRAIGYFPPTTFYIADARKCNTSPKSSPQATP